MVLSSLAAGRVAGSTFALMQDVAHAPEMEFRALTTAEVLRFTSERVQLLEGAGPDRAGSEVVRVFRIMNISDRHVSLSVELTGIPWARAALSRSVLGPGETAEIVVSGTPEEPGEYRGYLTVYGMGGFLELGMEFTIVVLPAEELDPCRPADGQPEAGIDLPAGQTTAGEAGPADPPDAAEPTDSMSVDQPGEESPDPEPAGVEVDDDGLAAEAGGEASGEVGDPGGDAFTTPGDADPCREAPVEPLPVAVEECLPSHDAALTEPEAGEAEEPGGCAPAAAPPPDGEEPAPQDGAVDGRTEEEQPAAEPGGDGSDGAGEQSEEDFAESETDAGESGGREADGSNSGGEQAGHRADSDRPGDGAGNEGSGVGDAGSGTADGGHANDGEPDGRDADTGEPGVGDAGRGGPDGGDAHGGELDGSDVDPDDPGGGQADSGQSGDGDTAGENPEGGPPEGGSDSGSGAGAEPADGAGEAGGDSDGASAAPKGPAGGAGVVPAGPTDGDRTPEGTARPDDPGQPSGGAGAVDNADTGGQTT